MRYYGTIEKSYIHLFLFNFCYCCYFAKWIMLEIVILVRVGFFPYGFKSLFQIRFFSCGSQLFLQHYHLTEMPYSFLWYLNIASVIANTTCYKTKCQLSMGPWSSLALPQVPLSSKICLDRIMKCSAASSVTEPAKRQLLVWLGCGLIPVSTI